MSSVAAISSPPLTITISRVRLPDVPSKTQVLKAPITNTDIIYLGDSDITRTGTGTISAVLSPGARYISKAPSLQSYHAVAANGSQTLYVGALA